VRHEEPALTLEPSAKPWALINLPPFPTVAARVMELISNDATGLKELADVIRADVAFSSEILTLANCALFAARTEITTILQAAALLGLNRVKGIAMTIGLKSYLTDSLKMPALLACWRHSLACAIVSEDLASACRMERDAAYLAGLLHDIGRLALSVVEPIAYAELIHEADESPIDVMARERELFGLDHCEAGKWLAHQWRIPAHFAEVAARHHQPVRPGKIDILAIVQLGCQLADAVGFAAVRHACPAKFEKVLDQLPQAALQRFDSDRDHLALKVATKINSIDTSLPVRPPDDKPGTNAGRRLQPQLT
jgi:putative nucleotidyltransferase with HDIG domain